MSKFWKLYMLFFAIPFPMILYYSISGAQPAGEGTNPWLALCLLLASVLFWAMLLYKFLRKWVLNIFKTRSDIEQLLRNGVRKEARIIKTVRLKSPAPDIETVEIQIEIENFAGVPITETLQINDSRPHEKRYEAGKTIRLRIDETLKNRPVLIPEDTRINYKRSVIVLSFLGWLLVASAVTAYYVFSYSYESNGTGWRFLTFWHPLVLCPVILVFYRGFFTSIIGRFFGSSEEALTLKYHGTRARAKILNASQTGTYINEQPQVRFDLEYEDARGEHHKVSVKKIISLLELNATRQNNVEIFYLKDDPQTIAFANDLNPGFEKPGNEAK